MDISAAATANIAEKDGEISLKGYADVTGETADETFNSLIGGNKAFTIEAVFNPNNVGSVSYTHLTLPTNSLV